MGTRITLDRSTVDFGLVRVGTEANTHINIRNPYKVPSVWSIHPVESDADISYAVFNVAFSILIH